jgi:type II secretory pathway component GspD/PulD (secretin)
MKLFIASVLSFVSIAVFAEDKMKLNYKDEDITKILEMYSKATGQSMIVDSSVRGKISIFNQNEVTKEEAFNQISEALALNGFAIITNGNTMTVRNARSAQRDNIPVFTTLPPAKPQRMATYIVSLKYASAARVQQQLRVLTSMYGEMAMSIDNNQLIFSDWTTNLQRIAEVIKQIDVPQDPKLKKVVSESREEEKAWQARREREAKTFVPPPSQKSDN